MQHPNSIPLHSVHTLMVNGANGPSSSSNHYYPSSSSSTPAVTSNAGPSSSSYPRASLQPNGHAHLKRDHHGGDPPIPPNSNANNSARPVKRSRKAINCEPCRASKLKCDRGKPCSGCVLRGTVSSCYPDSQAPIGDDPNDPNDDYFPNPRVDPRAELTRIRNSLLVLEQAINRSTATGLGGPGDVLGGGRRGGGGGGGHGAARMPDDPPPKPNEGGVFIGATSIASTLLSLRLRDRSDEDDSDSGENERQTRESSSDSLADYYDRSRPPSFHANLSNSASTSAPPLRSSNPFNEPSTLPPDSFSQAHIDDLLQALPDPSDIDTLIDNYFQNSTWLHRHLHEPTFRAAWTKFKSSTDENGGNGGGGGAAILLATVFVVLAISLQYLVPTHPIFQQLDGPAGLASTSSGSGSSPRSNGSQQSGASSRSPLSSAQIQLHTQTQVQVAIGAHYFGLAEIAYQRHLVETKALSMTLVEYLLLKVHYLNIRKEDCEQIWEVRGMLVSLGTAMGLHRDPGKWKMANSEVERRRWAWWNILQTDRWQAFLFGRPIGIANHHFDTQFPMEEPSPSSADPANPLGQITVSSNPSLAFLQFFRLVHLMGDIMDDATSIRPVSHERIMHHDRALDQLIRTLPPDMDVDDVYIARSLAPNQSAEAKRLAAQSIVHRSALHHVRFTLHRPFVTPRSMSTVPAAARQASLDIATTAAATLINVVAQSSSDYCKTNSLGVPGHLSWGSFHAFAAAMFFVFQLIWNADRPEGQPLAGAGIFRENVRRVQRSLDSVRAQIILAEKAYSVLEALKPLWEDPEMGGGFDGTVDEKRKMDVWAHARKLAFPCHDSPLHPTRPALGPSSESSPSANGVGASIRRGSAASPPNGHLSVGPAPPSMNGYSHTNGNNSASMNGNGNGMVVDSIAPYATQQHQNMHHNRNGHIPPTSYMASSSNQPQQIRLGSAANMHPNMMIAPPVGNHQQAPSTNGTVASSQYAHSPASSQPSGGYFDMGLGMGMGMGFANGSSEDPLWGSASLGLYNSTPQAQNSLSASGNGAESWASMYKFARD